jgi:hypothetical protein
LSAVVATTQQSQDRQKQQQQQQEEEEEQSRQQQSSFLAAALTQRSHSLKSLGMTEEALVDAEQVLKLAADNQVVEMFFLKSNFVLS